MAGSSEEPAELQTGAFHVAQAEALQALLNPEQSCVMAEKHTQLGNTSSWSCATLNCLLLLSQPAERVMTTSRYDDISPAASELAKGKCPQPLLDSHRPAGTRAFPSIPWDLDEVTEAS